MDVELPGQIFDAFSKETIYSPFFSFSFFIIFSMYSYTVTQVHVHESKACVMRTEYKQPSSSDLQHPDEHAKFSLAYFVDETDALISESSNITRVDRR